MVSAYSFYGTPSSENIPQTECAYWQRRVVPSAPTDLEKKLAAFLKKQRGELSFAQFSKITGLPASSLFRLEQCQQSITLGRLHGLMKKLKVTLADIFGDVAK